MSAGDIGPLLASGRDADVYDQGDGTVLRRSRSGRDSGPEARVMQWLVQQGFPVPRVHAADGPDLVMDRVAGPTMLDDLAARPQRLLRHARLLADLHHDLHQLSAPDWLAERDGVPVGASVLHLDLHPMNVIISPTGPVVIDWTNSCRGDGAFDVAFTRVILMSVEMSKPRDRLGRALLLGTFARRAARLGDRSGTERQMAAAIDYRLRDKNVTPGERRTLERHRAR
jgi:aminoglycoside phosphotransferase (APT) family kinase protein